MIITTGWLSGCVTTPAPEPLIKLDPTQISSIKHPTPSEITQYSSQTAQVLQALQVSNNLWSRIGYQLRWQHENQNTAIRIERERKKFLAQPRLFNILSDRANPGLAYIVREIERRQLPMELALVPIVESMLDPWAYSSQRAAGLWQISPATAHHYGVNINWWYDGRLDIPVATDFALNYLKELHDRFDGDWQLALAAYNCGYGRVSRAIDAARKAKKPTEYWSLSLPEETQRYVPKILALSQLIRSPERWGLQPPEISTEPKVATVYAGGQIELARAAQLARIETGELRRLNPGYLRWATAPSGSYELWLPADRITEFQMNLAALPKKQHVKWAYYQIAPGDNLSTIAQRFNTEVQVIKVVNNINNDIVKAGEKLKVPRNSASQNNPQLTSIKWPPDDRRPRKHRIRSGESLWGIARRYNLNINNLIRWNGLDLKSHIQPGQTLQLIP